MAQRELSLLTMLVVAVTTPTTLALVYYHYTKDPTLRPLSQTIERSVLRTQSGPMQVKVALALPPDLVGTAGERQLKNSIKASFAAMGVRPEIETRANRGAAQVRFFVGSSQFGPYPLSRASDGIRASATAIQLNGG